MVLFLVLAAISLSAQTSPRGSAVTQPADASKTLTKDSSIGEFITALDSDDYVRMGAAMRQLRTMGADARPAVPAIARILDRRAANRPYSEALGALQMLETNAEEAVPALIRVLGSDRVMGGDRQAASRALAAIGEGALPALRDAARSADPVVQIWANCALVQTEGSNSPGLLYLAEQVRNGGTKNGSTALIAIGTVGPLAAPIVPQLVAASQSSQIPQREFLNAFFQIGKGAGAAEPLMVAAAQTTDFSQKYRAIQTLAQFDLTNAKAAIPQFIEALNTEAPASGPAYPIREQAAGALGKIGPDAKAALPALIKTIHDPNVRTRAAAIRAISKIDPLNPEALREIALAMMDTNFQVQYAANSALAKAGPVSLEVIQGFIRAVRAHADDGVGERSYIGPPDHIVPTSGNFFAQFGPEQRYALSNLAEMAADPHPGVQQLALGAMAKVGEVPEKFIPVMLEHFDENFGTLRSMGSKAAPAVPALVKLLDDPRERFQAAEVLGSIGRPAAVPAVPMLEKYIREAQFPYPRVCDNLLQIDPNSKVALDVLERLTVAHLDDQPGGLMAADVFNAHATLIRAGREVDAHYRYLVAHLESSDERAAAFDVQAIMSLGPENPARRNAIERTFQFFDSGKDPWAVEYAAQVLPLLGPKDRAYVSRMIPIISKPPANERVRAVCSVLSALGKIGAGAREAVPALQAIADRKLQAPEDWEGVPLASRSETLYQKAAATALEKILGGEEKP